MFAFLVFRCVRDRYEWDKRWHTLIYGPILHKEWHSLKSFYLALHIIQPHFSILFVFTFGTVFSLLHQNVFASLAFFFSPTVPFVTIRWHSACRINPFVFVVICGFHNLWKLIIGHCYTICIQMHTTATNCTHYMHVCSTLYVNIFKEIYAQSSFVKH